MSGILIDPLKAKEVMAKEHGNKLSEYGMLLDFDKDVRIRAENISKAIFLLSGGSLTLSIGIFTRLNHPIITVNEALCLKWAWGTLFLSICCMLVVMLLMLIRSFRYEIAWSKQFKGETVEFPKQMITGIVVWAIGIMGMICCLAGLLLLAGVSVSVLK